MDGTIAEKLVPGGASAGASSDLQRDTQVVRRMVTEFGMRPTLGRVSNQAEVRSPFRGGGGVNNDFGASRPPARSTWKLAASWTTP